MVLEILCSEIIDELEGWRWNVNILIIVGFLVGIVGLVFVIVGVIVVLFIVGVFFGLIVGGVVIGLLSSVIVVGVNIIEIVLNKDVNEKFERYFMNISEYSRIMVCMFEDFEKEMEKIEFIDIDEIDIVKF